MQLKKDFLILLIGRLGQAGLALASIRILTTYLPKDQVGLTYLVATIVSYFALIFINPIGMYLNRHLHQWFFEGRLLAVFRRLNHYFLLVAIMSLPLVVLARVTFSVGEGLSVVGLCVLVFLNLWVSTWFQTLAPSLNLLEKRSVFVLINLLTQALGLLFSVLLIWIVGADAFVWLIGILISQAFGALVAFLYFRHLLSAKPIRPPSGEDVDHSRDERVALPAGKNNIRWGDLFTGELLRFCWPIALTTAFMWSQNSAYRIMVERSFGVTSLAGLGVGLGVAASVASIVESLVSQYFHPKFYAEIANGDKRDRLVAWETFYVNALSVFMPCMFYVFCLSKSILRILVHADYSSSFFVLSLGALIEFFRMITNVVYSISQSEKKTKSTIMPYGFGALTVAVGLSVIYFKNLAIDFVPWILVLAGLVSFVAMVMSMRKLQPLKIHAHFLGHGGVMCLPFALAFLPQFEQVFGDGFWMNFTKSAIFGVYMLVVIWILQNRIRKMPGFGSPAR